MNIDGKIHFSPKYLYIELNLDNKDKLIDAFYDRTMEFYLKPAKVLSEKENAFAVGVLCVTTIDFLARISINENFTGRINEWLKNNLPQYFDEYLAERFFQDFRNGLVHEGRVKNCSQFVIGTNELIRKEICERNNDYLIIVDASLLLFEIFNAFESYIEQIKRDDGKFHEFKKSFMRDFNDEIECAKNLNLG